MEKKTPRVGVFIDGENVPYTYANLLHSVAADFGEVTLAQVYAGFDVIEQWQHQERFKRVLTPSGKNATDIVICVDMIERACSGEFDVIVIGSSDKDFTHAVDTIRRMGMTVIGVCDRRPSQLLQMACHHYVNLEDNFVNAEAEIRDHLLNVLKGNGAVPLRAFESYIKAATGYGIIDIRAASWVDFFEWEAHHFQLTERGPHVMIGLAPEPVPEPAPPSVPCSMGGFTAGKVASHTAVGWFLPAQPVARTWVDRTYRQRKTDFSTSIAA